MKIHYDPRALPPYRVEWRPHLNTHWQLIQEFDSREEADAKAVQARKDWEGQTRIVTQHVIEATGLGS